MTLSATQETSTTTATATVDLRFYAGVAWDDLTLTDFTLRALPTGWADADTPGVGWTEITDRVHWNGVLTSERDGNAVKQRLSIRGENYDSDYFGLDQAVVVLDRIIVDGVTLYDWGLWFVGIITAGDNADDCRHGGAWSRELKDLSAVLALAHAPRMTAGTVNIAEGVSVADSSTLALASLEAGNGEFVGTTIDVDASNITDGNLNTVWISSDIPSVVGETPVASGSPHLVIDKVFISPVAGFAGLWWIEFYNQKGADAVQLAALTNAWYLTNETDSIFDFHIAEGTYGLDPEDRGIICSDRGLFDTYTGGARKAKWIVEAKSWRRKGEGAPGGELDGSAFNLDDEEGHVSLWSWPYAVPVDVVAWNQTGADPTVAGWTGGAIDISAVPVGEALRRYPSGTDNDVATDWRSDPNYEPGDHTEPNQVEWVQIDLTEQATTLTAGYTTPETTLSLSDTRGFPAPAGTVTEFYGYLEGETFTYTGRSTTGLTGVTGLASNHAEDALVYPLVGGQIMDGWPCSEIKISRKQGVKADGSTLPVLKEFEVRIQKTGYYETPGQPPDADWEQLWDTHWFTVHDNTEPVVSFTMLGANDQGFRWVRRILVIIQEMSDGGRAKLNEVQVKLAQTDVNDSGDGDISGARSAGLAEYLLETGYGLTDGVFDDETAITAHGTIGSHATAIAPYTQVLEDLARVTGCVARYTRAGGLTWRMDPWWPTGAGTLHLAPTGRLGSEHVRGVVNFKHQKPSIVGVVVRARSVDGENQYKTVWPPGAEALGPVREFTDYVVGNETDARYLAEALWYKEGLHYRNTGSAQEASLTIKGVGEWCGVDQWIELTSDDQAGELSPTEHATGLSNGGFELYTGDVDDGIADVVDSWTTAQDGGQVEIVTSSFHGGRHALKMNKTVEDDYSYAAQIVSGISASTVYRLRFWTRGSDTAESGRYKLTNQAGVDIIAVTSTAVSSSTWTEIDEVFTTPVGCTGVVLWLFGSAAATTGHHIYWDDVRLTRREPDTTSWLTERVAHEFRTVKNQRQWACKLDLRRFMR